jgi:hypothetical protein
MTDTRSKLSRLAENRHRRMADRSRPSFDLTADEVQRSTNAAMRLADAAPQQVAGRSARAAEATA